VAHWLADIVGPRGHVLATDIETGGLQHRSNLEVARHDVVEDDLPKTELDLIHARFLLKHLPEPDQLLRRLASALRPGGLLVVEDADGLDLVIDSDIAEITQICRAWERAASSVSWNPSLGGCLVSALAGCGLNDVQGVSYRRKAPGGPIWGAVRYGLIRLHDRLVGEGVSAEALALVSRALGDPAHSITGAPVAIAWGTRDR